MSDTTILLIRGIVFIIIELLCVDFFVNIFKNRRKLSLLKKIIIYFMWLLLAIINSCIDFAILRFILAIITASIAIWLLYSVNIFVSVLFVSIATAIQILIDAIVVIFVSGNLNIEKNENAFFIESIISKSFALILFIIMWKIIDNKKQIFRFQIKEWLCFFAFPIIICLLGSMMLFQKSDVIICLALLGLLCGQFIFLYSMQNVMLREKNTYETDMQNAQIYLKLETYKNKEKLYEQQKKYQHDLNNHLKCIHDLINNNEVEKAKDYLESLQGELYDDNMMINTNNVVINSILRIKIAQAKEKGIHIILKINDMSSITIKEKDLIIVIGNLLDNAIEAIENINQADKKIYFNMHNNNGILEIVTQNKTLNIDNGWKSNKRNKEEHGFGLKNINDIVKLYNGEDMIFQSDDIVTHMVSLKVV